MISYDYAIIFIYNYFITIEYNTKKIVPNKGSAIFLHLTKIIMQVFLIGAVNTKEVYMLMLRSARTMQVGVLGVWPSYPGGHLTPTSPRDR